MRTFFSLLLLLAVMLLPITAPAEDTAPIPQAAPYDLASTFEAYPGYRTSGETWELVSHETLAMLEYLQRAASGNTVCGFYFSLRGNLKTGLVIPYLHVFYQGSSAKLHPSSVSILVSGVRYDFSGTSSDLPLGNVTLELLSFPLDQAGIGAWRAVAAENAVKLLLSGDKTYAVDLLDTDAPRSIQQHLGTACFAGSATLLSIADAAVAFNDYQLWDLNAAYCATTTGVLPKMTSTELSWALDCEPFSNTSMGLLCVGDSGKRVRLLQDQLTQHGFLVGSRDDFYGEQTQSAVLLAQKYYGLLCTGCADRVLYDCMTNNESPRQDSLPSRSGKSANVGALSLVLSRYWFASSASAAQASGILGSISADNADEALLILDGTAENTGTSALLASSACTAGIFINGMEFPAKLLFERDNGALLEETLPPTMQTRFVLVAQVPHVFAQNASKIVLRLSGTETTQDISLT